MKNRIFAHALRGMLACVVAPIAAYAQFYSYPAFQPPRVTPREYNFAMANGNDSGTSLLFQWREGIDTRSLWSLDAGLADPAARGASARIIIGGGYALAARRASDDLPLDLMVTAGLGGSFGDGTTFLRIPFGLSVGHRFEFSSPFAVTPYAHPRLAIDYCSVCSTRGRHDTNLGVDVDLGVSVDITSNIALRASMLFSGSDFFGRDNAIGLALVWTPATLK